MNLCLIPDEERSIFSDVIVLASQKKVHVNLCLIPDEERTIFFYVMVLATVRNKSSYELASN
jgi:hypothetical protein